ncbi:MAG: hypothetical protein JSS27_11535 [Planctomycetes bacterium]|nr:hypothetical protein [Planctomycetota bacterium]
MRFALLGLTATTHALGQAAQAAGHEVTAAYPGLRSSLEPADAGQSSALADDWQALLGGKIADAVIVGHSADELRLEQLRTLIQAGVPLLVEHPVVDSMLSFYELDMHRQGSTGAVLMPFIPARWHPAVARLAEMVAAGERSPIGQVDQLIFDRPMPVRDRQQVRSALASDIDLLRTVAGTLRKIGAMSSATAAGGIDWANLNVQTAGPSGCLVRWSIGPVEDRTAAQVALVGRSGKATLTMPIDEQWVLQIRTGSETRTETYDEWNPTAEAIERFELACAGQPVEPTWLDACRDMEIVDAVERSVARGRTIDVYGEEQTEQGTFKGMMAAGGCVLLMVALLATIVATTAVYWGVPGASYWPYVLFGLLGAFLILQTLRLAWPTEKK